MILRKCYKIFAFILAFVISVGMMMTVDSYAAVGQATKTIPLLGENNEVVAYYCGDATSYCITDNTGEEIIEYSTECNPYRINSKNDYYYAGPRSMFSKVDGNTLLSADTGEVLTENQVDFSIQAVDRNDEALAESNSAEKNNEFVERAVSSAQKAKILESGKLKYATKKYDYNPDGRCGSVALAIIYRYYNDHVNEAYVAKKYETSDGVALIKLLTNKYLGKGTNYDELQNGGSKYLSARKTNTKLTKKTGLNSQTVYSTIKKKIQTNRPLVVGLLGHKKYGNHWVVGTGYKKTKKSDKIRSYIVVNDGWGNTNVNINLKYVDGCVRVIKK